MMKQTLRFTLVLCLAFIISAPPCWAKSIGYLYVVGYSLAPKKVYFSQVIMQKVRDISYSDEEYVTEVELIQKVESHFQKYLASVAGVNPADYTISVKGAYKRRAIAEARLKADKDRYASRKYMVEVLSHYFFSD